jgi:hypothetical protein
LQSKAQQVFPPQKENDNNPDIYSHTIDGVGDGTHLIIASFIKTNEKIQEQLVTNFGYFSELMHANIDGLQIHPLNTDKSLPILTSPKDKNIPTTGINVRDYFYIQNSFSLIPGMHTKPKAPPQKVGDDGRFQFDENRQYDGPERITGVMSVSAPGNVKCLAIFSSSSKETHINLSTNLPNARTARLRRCFLEFPRVCVVKA